MMTYTVHGFADFSAIVNVNVSSGKIAVCRIYYTESGTNKIYADSVEDAIDGADLAPLFTDGEYVDGSFSFEIEEEVLVFPFRMQ